MAEVMNVMGSMSYKKLWKMLIYCEMLKKDLREGAGLSTVSMAKLAKNRNVNTDILVKVCTFLKCNVSNICDVEFDEAEEGK